MVVSIDKVVSDFIQQEMQNMDLEDIITSEVRDCWDMDQLDRVDETVDRVDAIEAWIQDAEDKLSPQNVTDLKNSVKNLVEHTNILQLRIRDLEDRLKDYDILQLRIRDLEDRLKDYDKIREMVWESANKSFIQKLMFWR